VENTGLEGLRVVWIINSELQGGSPHLIRLRTDHLAPVSKFDFVLAHIGFMGPHKLVASYVTELDNTLPRLWMSRRDSVGPPTDYPPRHSHGR
jgi:hypothetical protein